MLAMHCLAVCYPRHESFSSRRCIGNRHVESSLFPLEKLQMSVILLLIDWYERVDRRVSSCDSASRYGASTLSMAMHQASESASKCLAPSSRQRFCVSTYSASHRSHVVRQKPFSSSVPSPPQVSQVLRDSF